MKTIASMLAALCLAGCAMTPMQRKVTAAVVVVAATGAIAAHHHKAAPSVSIPRPPDCRSNPEVCR